VEEFWLLVTIVGFCTGFVLRRWWWSLGLWPVLWLLYGILGVLTESPNYTPSGFALLIGAYAAALSLLGALLGRLLATPVSRAVSAARGRHRRQAPPADEEPGSRPS